MLDFLLNYWEILLSLICLIVQIYVVWHWSYSRNKKLRDNLKKPLFLYEFQNNILQRAEEILKNSDFITRNRTTDLSSLDDLKTGKHSILIVGYVDIPDSDQKMLEILNIVKGKRIPLIIFCNSQCRINMAILSAYSYYEICNTPLRLTMLITNICQNFDYK